MSERNEEASQSGGSQPRKASTLAEQMTPYIQEVLTTLRVNGSTEVGLKEVRRLGAELYKDPDLLEAVVLDLVESRRDQMGSPVVKPYATVSMGDVYRRAKEAKAYSTGQEQGVDLEQLHRDRISKAHKHLLSLRVDKEDLERAMFETARETGRRAIHAESFILNEPIGMDRFVKRLGKQASEDGSLRFGDLIARTLNYVESQYERHTKIETFGYTSQEQVIYMLEEDRLGRLRALSRMALLPTIEVIHLSGYDENGED